MNKLPKKELEYISRMEVIHSNFFKYLKEKKITQKKFAIDNDIPESTVSKWKSNTICMSEEHIYKAAKYLEIYVNDLFYTDREKKTIDVLSKKAYDPIMAQKEVKIRKLNILFNHPLHTIRLQLGAFLIICIIFMFVSKQTNWNWSFINLSIIFLFWKDLYSRFSVEEVFVINYLDDIYYSIDQNNNQFRRKNILINVSCFLTYITMFTLLIFQLRTQVASPIIIVMLIMTVIMLIYTIVSAIYSTSNMKKEIYQYEIVPYVANLVNICFVFVYTSFGIWLTFENIVINWYYLFPLTTLFVLSLVLFLNVSKKYSEYKLIYLDSANNTKRELFND